MGKQMPHLLRLWYYFYLIWSALTRLKKNRLNMNKLRKLQSTNKKAAGVIFGSPVVLSLLLYVG
jgi:hypothetical protein